MQEWEAAVERFLAKLERDYGYTRHQHGTWVAITGINGRAVAVYEGELLLAVRMALIAPNFTEYGTFHRVNSVTQVG